MVPSRARAPSGSGSPARSGRRGARPARPSRSGWRLRRASSRPVEKTAAPPARPAISTSGATSDQSGDGHVAEDGLEHHGRGARQSRPPIGRSRPGPSPRPAPPTARRRPRRPPRPKPQARPRRARPRRVRRDLRRSRAAQPAPDRPGRPPQLAGRLVLGHPLQVAEHDRRPVLRGQSLDLLVEDRRELAILDGSRCDSRDTAASATRDSRACAVGPRSWP